MTRPNRSLRDIEYEIVNQIYLCEICFDVCKAVPKLPGRGSDFLPFYYNLNFSKGVISLHSLLLSNSPGELSIRNFLAQYKADYSREDTAEIEAKVASIADAFKKVLPLSLRHKVAAHIDQEFKHANFTSAYIVPDAAEKYAEIVRKLKDAIFAFTNYAQDDYPHGRILEQSKTAIEQIISESDETYRL
ncbi:MAG: hypothetical protein WDN10_01835 [bacterium]